MSNFDYSPPSSAIIRARQDDPDALRLLLAQRRYYRRAKRWLNLRLFGMAVIGLAAPVISVANADLAVYAGAVAGLWLFLGRTLLVFLQSLTTAKAAAVQESFDFYVYGMPTGIERSELPSLEQIAKKAGPDEMLDESARTERLYEWYPIDDANSGVVTVAIAQRANASYADHLLKTTAVVWAVVTSIWLLALVGLSIAVKLSLLTFLAGVVLPILPAFLDILQYVIGIWRASLDRRDLAETIQKKLTGSGESIDSSDLSVWQERLYGLRRSTPEVPDFIYKIQRKANERAMHSAAQQLGKKAKDSGQ